MRIIFTYLFIILSQTVFSQSIFSSGNWYKIGLTEEGIYKLSGQYLMQELDIPSSVAPNTIKIYGIKGGMLPQPNAIERPSDPVQLPLYAVGETDGVLQADDYFLFYAEGPHQFTFDSLGTPVFDLNLYADTAYYFVTYAGEPGLRIQSKESQNSGNIISTYTQYLPYEQDLINTQRYGREWLGEAFRKSQNRTQSFTNSLSGVADSVSIWLKMAATSLGTCNFDISINENLIGSIELAPILEEQYNDKIKYSKGVYKTALNSSKVDLKLTFNGAENVSTSIGYLDQYILGLKRKLSLSEQSSILIKNKESKQRTYEISGVDASSYCWDISNPLSPALIKSSGNGIYSGNFQNLLIFKGSDFSTPEAFHSINNQNIKSLSVNQGIIITVPEFYIAAQRLAEFHSSQDQLSIGIVTTSQIYNEFSSGRQDISAIRDFLRYCYLNGGNLKYATLMGDASFDYKKRIQPYQNFVPVYESRESSHNLFSYSSDDYFGFFEENEGEWYEGERQNNSQKYIVPAIDHTMEIGVGRLPVKSSEEAEIVVDKIIRYKTTSQTYGKWRNQVAYLVEDGDNDIHMYHAENLTEILDTIAPQVTSQKLYLDRFDKSVPNGTEARPYVLNAIKEGVFMFNFIGHGNESQLTKKLVIETSVINSLSNRHKLPLFVTATCEFGKYDNPAYISGAEQLLLLEEGGAIGLLCTTRPVYAHTNLPINQALHRNLFSKVDGEHPRLGDIIKNTKNQALRGTINRNFALLGDPMLVLDYPKYDIVFDQLENEQDTLSALEKYHLSGRVVSGNDLVNNFSGTAILALYDIPQTKLTLGQSGDPFRFIDDNNAIFRGEVTVTDGKFALDFILPKNISYKYQTGKISMYAWNDEELIDATGASRNFVLGGTAQNNTVDNTPPTVKLFINDNTFSNGNTVGPNSLLIAQVADENGINIANDGLTQGITLQLNDETPIDLNGYYTAHSDTYESGTVMFPLQNLTPGHYTAKLKVLDAYNNFTTATVDFKVSEKAVIRLFNVTNYPNPVSQYGETSFRFEHDREDERLEVSIMLYDMKGQIVKTLQYDVDNSPRTVDDLSMNLIDHHGQAIDRGVYLYRIVVTSSLDNATNEVVKRLIIIN